MCQTWAIALAITNTLLPMVKQCILNQSQGFQLLLNALAYAFTLCISMKSKVVNIKNLNQPLIQGDFD
jgi:predicted Kef-type K+ transport protein